jgi:predicted Zn-ribbon and HTH transcriptional regulator
MNIQETPPPGGLQASQHASVHPQRVNNTGSPEGVRREGGDQPPAQSTPKGPPAPSKALQGQNNQSQKLKEKNNTTKNANKLIEDMQRALDAPQAPSSLTLLSLLQRAQTTILHLYENQTTHNNLSTILIALNNNLKTTTHSPPPKTWAQAASQGQLAMPSPPPIPTESHVILVRMGEKEDQEKVKKSTNKEILQGLSHPGVIAVKKLESGDVRVFVATKSAKDTLTTDPAWAQKDFPSALPITPQFQVLVHGIRVKGFDPKEVGTNIKVQEENGRLHPSLKVAQASWLKSIRAREGKTHTSVIFSVQSQTQANEIVLKGLVHQGTILTAEDFHPQQRPTQCLNCGQFGHIAKFCKAEQACGKCSSKHRTDECNEGKKKCSNCQGSHPAWSLSCMVKQAAIAKARSFRAQAMKGWLSCTRTTSPVEDEEGFTIVGSKRKATEQPNQRSQSVGRKLPGKPFGSNATIMAGRNQSNKITNALNPVGNSQDNTLSSQRSIRLDTDLMEDIQASQNE